MGQWEAATGLVPHKVGKRGFGTYLAADYDELVDCPVEMGAFWSGEFKAGGVPHRLVVSGASDSFDHARLLADVHKICEAEIRFWHDRNARRTRATSSCSTWWTTATAGWSIATPPR